jgi:outer membrane protein OmpA-like peptidoglycan-associated protein
LYFSSDGHPGLGNLDIFVATRNVDKTINIENMGAPVNSSADDFGIYLKTALEGYISSNRAGGKGDDDIYVIRNTKNDLKIVKFVLVGKTLEKTESGVIELKGTKVRLIDDQMSTLGEMTSNDSSVYTFNIDANRNYTLLAEYPNHYAKREPFTTFGKQPPQEQLTEKETIITLNQDLILDPLKKNQSFVLDNIYFDFNKFDIKDSAAIELDKVVTILTDNPAIEIEMSSHTDSRGSKEYNTVFSQKRAESTVAYLVSKGIEAKRLSAKGYAFEKPIIADAVTEEDHQRNRRTEFKVTKINAQ